ncbi:hypothetical protein [Sulfurovum mangrovi]|uniref:hypothetical protein n=1 Tax=Sulfurovum mangrovi TaxID=2893889 RepID=UPI001E4DD428|nr:hypothetical protein [Sulfurovum mangrovi]UFH59841.1 hypothetical protein LN246_03110 [Sulfurovum mangrovi]UFH59892.1 hypothetical protein LN246_03370 [Sulfurovum mangrovi]
MSNKYSGTKKILRGVQYTFDALIYYAIQMTEEIRVSISGTPLFFAKNGDEFLLSNSGTYVFDRDTTVMVSYVDTTLSEPILLSDDTQAEVDIPEYTWVSIFQVASPGTYVDATFNLDYVAGFRSTLILNERYAPSSASVRLRIGDDIVYTKTIYAPSDKSSYQMWYAADSAEFNHTIYTGDIVRLEVYWSDSDSLAMLESAGGDSVNGELTLTIS